MGSPSRILLGGIVLMDEPENCGVSTFAENGEVLLTLGGREGGDVGQIIVGLSARQAAQLFERLSVHIDFCRVAIALGKGGAEWPSVPPTDGY